MRWQRNLALALALSGVASAATLPECSVAAATIDPGKTTLTAFLPNAPCLIMQNVASWAQWGLWQAMAKIGLTLTATFFFFAVGQAAMTKTWEKMIFPFLAALVITLFVAPATKGQGIIPIIQAESINSMTRLYVAAASVGDEDLNDPQHGVAAKTKKLGRNIALLVARASHGQAIREQMIQIKAGVREGNLADPNLAQELYAERLKNEQAGADSIFDPNSQSWIFNVGYAVIFGLFAVFAGIITATAWIFQLGLLVLPLALSFIVLGNYRPVQAVGFLGLGAMLTIGILPLMTSSMATLAISIPADRIAPTVEKMNADTLLVLNRSQELINNGCSMTDVGCKLEFSIFNKLLLDIDTMKEQFMSFLMMLAAGLVGLSIALSVLRQGPAALKGIFGSPGGGESSGVETGSLSRSLGLMAGGSLVQRAMQNKALAGLMGRGSGTPKGSGPGGGRGGGPGGGSGGAGGANVPPPEVTSEAGNGTSGTTSTDIPPSSVTAGMGTGGTSVFASSFSRGLQGGRPVGSAALGAAGASVTAAAAALPAKVRGQAQAAFAADKAKTAEVASRLTPNLQRDGQTIQGLVDKARTGAANFQSGTVMPAAQSIQNSPQASTAARAAAAAYVAGFSPALEIARPPANARERVANAIEQSAPMRAARAADAVIDGDRAARQASPDVPTPEPAPAPASHTVTPASSPAAYNAVRGPSADGSSASSSGSVVQQTMRPPPAPRPQTPAPAQPPLQKETAMMQERAEQGTGPDIREMKPGEPTSRAVYSANRGGQAIEGVSTGPLTPAKPAPAPAAPTPARPPARASWAAERSQGQSAGDSTPPATPVLPTPVQAEPPKIARPPRE